MTTVPGMGSNWCSRHLLGYRALATSQWAQISSFPIPCQVGYNIEKASGLLSQKSCYCYRISWFIFRGPWSPKAWVKKTFRSVRHACILQPLKMFRLYTLPCCSLAKIKKEQNPHLLKIKHGILCSTMVYQKFFKSRKIMSPLMRSIEFKEMQM